MIPILAAINGQDFFWVIIQICIAALIYFVITWGIAQVGIPEPFAKIIKFLLILMVVVFLVNALLTLGGHPMIKF